MNTRSVTAHSITICITTLIFYFLDILINRYQPFLFTGSTIVDVLYYLTVIFLIFLVISVSINIIFIIYYVRNKDYIVSSTYELRLYEKSILYLETFTIMYPITIYVITIIISIIALTTRG